MYKILARLSARVTSHSLLHSRHFEAHQFDVKGEDDHFEWYTLCGAHDNNLHVIRQIEEKNGNDVACDDAPNISASTSTDTTESSSRGFSEQGEDDEETNHSLHAMVLVGFRHDKLKKDKYWFLVQNTWKKMPLLELLVKYVAKHLNVHGELNFIGGNLKELPTSIGRCHSLYLEASFDDGGELEEEEDDGLLEEAVS